MRKKAWYKQWYNIASIVMVVVALLICGVVAVSHPQESADASLGDNEFPSDIVEPAANIVTEEDLHQDTDSINDETNPGSQEEAEMLDQEPVQRQDIEQTTPARQEQVQLQSETDVHPEGYYEVDGYCKDGTPVRGWPSARGKANVCYGHKGWQDEY